MRRNYSSNRELNWVKRCDVSQADYNKVLDDYYHVTYALKTFHFKGYVITIVSFFRRELC